MVFDYFTHCLDHGFKNIDHLNNLIIHIFMIDFNIFKIECPEPGTRANIKYV